MRDERGWDRQSLDLQSLPAADFGEVPVETERHEPWLVRDNRPFAFSLDSQQILAFGRGGRLQRWDLAGGREMEGPAIEHPGGRIVAISPDGILLATMGTDGCARLWNSHTGALRRTLPGAANPNSGWFTPFMAFSPDGALLATAAFHEGVLRIWEVDSGALKHTLRLAEYVRCLAFSPSGEHLAIPTDHFRIAWIAMPAGSLVSHESWHSHEVASVAFSPNSETLVSGGSDRTLSVLNVVTRQGVGKLRGHSEAVRAVAWSPDGRWIASGGSDGTLRLWDAEALEQRVCFRQSHPVVAVAFSPDGRTLAACDSIGRIILRFSAPSAEVSRQADIILPEHIAVRPNVATVWRPSSGRKPLCCWPPSVKRVNIEPIWRITKNCTLPHLRRPREPLK